MKPFLAMAGIVLGLALTLLLFGHPWWCACGHANPVSTGVPSGHESQHLFDPYSLTHMLHGLIFCGVIAWMFPRWSWAWGLCLAIALEAGWELLENTPFVIERYRTHTGATEYLGDSIANSLGDILSTTVGFLLARRIGLWPSVAVFVGTELFLLWWIRDSLMLTVLMLVFPSEALKAWQAG